MLTYVSHTYHLCITYLCFLFVFHAFLCSLNRKNFGNGPRSFMTSKQAGRGVDADLSAWTDTPADRARKAQDQAEGKPSAAKRPKHENSGPTAEHIKIAEQVVSVLLGREHVSPLSLWAKYWSYIGIL